MAALFPFSAIVGQDEMKLALLAAAIDPTIGGVLVFGDRGTGKSTAVRALAALLPQMRAIVGCRYDCDPAADARACEDGCKPRAKRSAAPKSRLVPVPVVDLPLGATEDRVVGALDLERALAHGEKAFEPGLLARAHRGFLYIDEVNLLEDHLVDLLLDVAASGENVVEREGLSVRHPARFVLVGSGNPEEGELRPQLLDRFGLSVEVRTPDDLAGADRGGAAARRRSSATRRPSSRSGRRRRSRLRRRIVVGPLAARDDRASRTRRSSAPRSSASALGTDGLRGELTLIRAARAVAGARGRRRGRAMRICAASRRRRCVTGSAAIRSTRRARPTRVERAVAELFGA